MDKIPTVISNLRKEKSWSQSDLSDKSGVSREMISKYERGLAVPSVDAAKKMADAFGVSLDYLVGEGINSSFDKRNVQRIQAIEEMEKSAREQLFAVMDAFIRDYKTRQAYAS